VAASERLARAAIHPIHFDPKSGKVKVAFIRQSDLAHGHLSVWRLEKLPSQDPDELQGFFGARCNAEHSVKEVYAPPASAVRLLSLPQDGRGYCVLDDTKTGPEDEDVDPAHAAITLCHQKRDHGDDETKLRFAREALKSLFLTHPV
jgi:hypothetical protein